MNVVRETFEVNRRALELGLEPPVCVTWRASSDPGLDDEPCNIGRPAQSVDSARLRAFVHLMYEIGES